MNIVKLYGLNHSGSHYLSWLLHNNFKDMVILRSHTGWDHGKIIDQFNWDECDWNTDPHYRGDRCAHGALLKNESLNNGYPVTEYKNEIQNLYQTKNLPIIILMRNPYDWMYSYNIKHKREHWYSTLNSSVIQWSEINKNYIEHPWPKKHFIKYESLRDNTSYELDRLSNFLKITRNNVFLDSNKDMVRFVNGVDSAPKYKIHGGYQKCKEEHIKEYGLDSEEFDEIVNENIDMNVLDFYNKL